MATERRDEREEVDDDKEGDRKGYTPRGEPVDIVYMGGDMPPLEGNAYLPDFTLGRAHLLFQGLYGYFPHTTTVCTWIGESRTTLSGSVLGAGWKCSRLAGMPRPLEK